MSFCGRRMRRLNDPFYSVDRLLDDHSSLATEERDPRSLRLSFPPLIPFVMSCLLLVIDMNPSAPIRICLFRRRIWLSSCMSEIMHRSYAFPDLNVIQTCKAKSCSTERPSHIAIVPCTKSPSFLVLHWSSTPFPPRLVLVHSLM